MPLAGGMVASRGAVLVPSDATTFTRTGSERNRLSCRARAAFESTFTQSPVALAFWSSPTAPNRALARSIASRSVDAYTIAFGLRNVTGIDAALAEAHRVLKPGGRFFVLEFSHVVVPGLRQLYDAYSFTLLPKIGKMVAGDEAAYRYLVESIRKFPDQDSLAKRIAAAGFGQVRVRNLTGGIAAIHSGWRL